MKQFWSSETLFYQNEREYNTKANNLQKWWKQKLQQICFEKEK